MGALKNAKDEKFALEYIQHYDAKAAALAAGYAYSTARNAAAWIHPDHPTKPGLKRRIDELISEDFKRLGVTPERIRLELARIAFATPVDLVDQDRLEINANANRNDLAAVSSISIKRGKVDSIDVRMCDKMAALKLLEERYGMPAGKKQDDSDEVKIIRTADGGIEVDDGTD